NWSRPRDLAHYEDFEHYHATFYRQVEALSVTPFTRRALDRGATGTFVAAVRNTVEHHSREGDAHDVDLDGPEARRITERMLARAERVGGPRGRDYLEERLNRLRDTWQRERTGEARLGYGSGVSRGQRLKGLLTRAGTGSWDDTTVGMSMRETENEINLLVPGNGGVYHEAHGAPEWSFAPPDGEDPAAGSGTGEEVRQ